MSRSSGFPSANWAVSVRMKAGIGFTAAISAIAALTGGPCSAQVIRPAMKDAFEAYKALQPYLGDSRTFVDPANSKFVGDQLVRMSKSFHSVEALGVVAKKDAGFAPTVRVVEEMLDDALSRFNEGKREYAHWRLRTLGHLCVGCHAAHNASWVFQDPTSAPVGLAPFRRGEFYLSSRQFDKAKGAFLEALQEPRPDVGRMTILRRWLLVELWGAGSPKNTSQELARIGRGSDLSAFDTDEVARWRVSLDRWTEAPRPMQSLADIAKLVETSSSNPMTGRPTDAVSLLKAAGGLHQHVYGGHASGPQRARALLLLGSVYDELPLFFLPELADIYLEQAMNEFPGSPEARTAYVLYEERVTRAFSGSGGTDLPTEVKVRLMELKRLANGVPEARGKV